MAYAATDFYIPSDPTIQNSTFFFFPPQNPSLSLLPGEAASSAYYSYDPSDIPTSDCAPNSAHLGPLTPRRRNAHFNDSHPYHYETSRSPTRTRFNAHDLSIPSPANTFNIPSSTNTFSPTRAQFHSNGSAFTGPERYNKTYGRPSHEDSVSQSPKKSSKARSALQGPTNYILIPQALFKEPTSTSFYQYRHPDITFHMANGPEVGVKVGALNRSKIPLLSGAEDPVFQDIQDREIKVRILWPGYSTVSFEKRMKTLHESMSRTRTSVVIKLAQIILEFSNHLRLTKAQVDPGQERWMVDTSGHLGISCSDVFITKLVHRGGSHWQMELWCPKEMM